nr:DUF2953 domain-containing protein [Robertmurraya korlensis]
MKWLLLILIVMLLLFLLIMFLKIKVFIHFYHGQDDDHLKIKFKALFGLIQYKLEVPIIQIDDDTPTVVMKTKKEPGKTEQVKGEETSKFSPKEIFNSFYDFEVLIKHVVGLHKIVRRFLKKVTIKDIKWDSVIGVGNAAYTGMFTGACWAAKGSIIGLLSTYMRMRNLPQITVTPHFQMPISQTTLTCMIQFRIGHAMLAGIKLIKFWKGGRPNFKTKPLSTLSNEKSKSI